MANRNRQIELGVNFWLSNDEIESLRTLIRKSDESIPERPHWLAFLVNASTSPVGEEESVRILPD